MLEELNSLVNKLKATSSRNDKIIILKQNDWCKDIIHDIYNPNILYNVTSKKCKKMTNLGEPMEKASSLEDLLNMLRDVSGHESVRLVNTFINEYGYDELVYSAVDKNLKCRIDDTVINMAFPGLIPTFDVALAKNYSDFAHYVNDDWFWSRKLDGVRLIAQKRGNDVTYWSRQGKPFGTLKALTEEIRAIEGDVVLDGEVCLVIDGVEDFQATMKEIRKKDHTIQNPKFFVFDILTPEEFDNKTSKTILSERLKRLELNGKFVTKLEQQRIGEKDLYSYPEEWEGLILRKDCPYEGKRTKNLLKVKKFDDAEYEVIGIGTGPFQLVEDGREIQIETLTNVLIEHKGNAVSVGSGFSVDERKEFYDDPTKIIGKTITVQYFGTSTNKDGKESLRFPTLKAIYRKKREI